MVIFKNIYLCIHTYIVLTIETVNLKENSRGMWEDLEGRKGEQKYYNQNLKHVKKE